MSIKPDFLNENLNKFKKENISLVQNAVSNNSIASLAVNRDTYQDTNFHFNVKVKPRSKITNQKSSGRCWIFAALNMMRINFIKENNLSEFEFSQSYLFFWDKLERANYFLMNVIKIGNTQIDMFNKDHNQRLLDFYLNEPTNDGGQWDMLKNLIKKYGLVPKSVFPESRHSSNSRELNNIISVRLREASVDIIRCKHLNKDKTQSEINSILNETREKCLDDIYRILLTFLGTPPRMDTKFSWRTMKKDDTELIINDVTPTEFFENHVKFNLNNYICVVDDPRNERNKLYTVESLGNLVEGDQVTYLNLEVDRIKELTRTMLENNHPVWFGCDVGKKLCGEECVMDPNLIDLSFLNLEFKMDKKDRLEYHASLMTHAMNIMGVNVIDDKTTKWEIENSWGEKGKEKGYYMMTDKWFDEYVYEVLICKDYLTDEEKKVIEDMEYNFLPPWDPMGALAKE